MYRDGDIVVRDSVEEMRAFLVSEILLAAAEAISRRGRFVLGVSGGSMVELLCCAEFYAAPAVDYKRWTMLLVDERMLPRGHPEHTHSTYVKRLSAEFLASVAFPDPVHVGGEETTSLDQAAEEYAAWIAEKEATIDLLLLGIGPDGHVASLFPPVHPEMLEESRRIVPVPNSPKPPAARISMSLPFLRSSRRIVYAASGANKHEAITRIVQLHDKSLPASHLPGLILVDRAASTGAD